MNAAVVGTGRMGQTIAWAMETLQCDSLTLADTDENNLKTCSRNAKCPTNPYLISRDTPTNYSFLRDVNVVISALPYHQNENLAHYCIDNRIPYCDLGGHRQVSRNINDYATTNGKAIVMTDLGLAPGWVNIIAEYGYWLSEIFVDGGTTSPPKHIEMMVGGLPIHPTNYLKYNCTWSYDGLVNEYLDDCFILSNGKRREVRGMDGLIPVDTKIGTLEAFYTSGGAAHTIETMQQRGVRSCVYRTLRYPGHREAVRFLVNECGLSRDALAVVFEQSCPAADDLVIIKVEVDNWKEEIVIECNSRFSAMQMATAFPISAVAHLIGTHVIKSDKPLAYKDIPYTEFKQKLDFLFEEIK